MEKFGQFPEIVHGFSTRDFGNMKFGFGNDREVVRNRQRFAKIIGFNPDKIVEAEQVHGARIVVVGKEKIGQEIKGVDGLVTGETGIYLLIKMADCIPILYFDPSKRIIGIAHAGWKGILAKIGSEIVKLMETQFGCMSRDILIGLGPSIGSCCYVVLKERALKFRRKFGNEIVWKRTGKWHLGLKKAVYKDLTSAGVLSSNIEFSSLCTSCQNNLFFSYRREGESLAGEIAGVLGIKKSS